MTFKQKYPNFCPKVGTKGRVHQISLSEDLDGGTTGMNGCEKPVRSKNLKAAVALDTPPLPAVPLPLPVPPGYHLVVFTAFA